MRNSAVPVSLPLPQRQNMPHLTAAQIIQPRCAKHRVGIRALECKGADALYSSPCISVSGDACALLPWQGKAGVLSPLGSADNERVDIAQVGEVAGLQLQEHPGSLRYAHGAGGRLGVRAAGFSSRQPQRHRPTCTQYYAFHFPDCAD